MIPGDFTQDGKLDLLVMSEGSASKELDIYLYVGLPEGGFSGLCIFVRLLSSEHFPGSTPLSAPASSMAQPIPMDLNGDLKIDLLGAVPSTTSTFKAWQNVWNASELNGPIFSMCVLSSTNDTFVGILTLFNSSQLM